MMPKELLDDDMSEAIDGLRTRQEAFALATIIRTAGATAAKPGAKAVLDAQGQIVFGWIGGGLRPQRRQTRRLARHSRRHSAAGFDHPRRPAVRKGIEQWRRKRRHALCAQWLPFKGHN